MAQDARAHRRHDPAAPAAVTIDARGAMSDCLFETFRPVGDVAIDATEDARLRQFRARCEQLLPGRVRTHRDRDTAVAHCRASRGEAILIGHGRPGLIGTGCGEPERRPPPGTFIDVDHLGDWANATMTSLRVIACNAGAGDEGRALAHVLAVATRVPVVITTGFVWIGAGCQDMYLEPGSSWLRASGEVDPSPDSPDRRFAPSALRLVIDGALTSVALDDVESVTLRVDGSMETWDRKLVRDCLAALAFDLPVAPGDPLAYPTGQLDLTFRWKGEPQVRSFIVLNDRYVQDRDVPHVFYRADIANLLRG